MQFDLFAPCYQSVEPNAIDLLRRMLVIDQKRRITAKDALNHPYFTGNNVVLTPSSVERIGSTEMVDEKAEVSSPNWTNVTETKPVQKRQTRVFAVHKGWENAVVE